MKEIYVVVDIGCIECGEDSTVLYVGTDLNKAKKIKEKYEGIQEGNWSGQHSFEIYKTHLESENVAIKVV